MMKPRRDSHTLVAEVVETPRNVGSSPSMAHGCRPYSATIQPSSAANQGNGKLYKATRRNQRFRSSRWRDAKKNATANKAMRKIPSATMNRKLQKRTGTFGTVDHAARSICSDVAAAGSRV